MDFRLVGSILLIIGTSIGAGMLALPIATAQLGFFGATLLLCICWIIMTLGAFLLLEVNLWLPQRSNIVSMSRATMGPLGQIVSWITYLLLLYSLLCAYITGGSDLFHSLLLSINLDIPLWLAAIIFTIFFGAITFLGIRSVDYVNRGLMLIKLCAYFLLVGLLTPFISFEKLKGGEFQHITSASAIMITIVSFGYATIVPSLRVYFSSNLLKLKTAIFLGSLIPLFLYTAWDAVNMGIIPITGAGSFDTIAHSTNSTSMLVHILNSAVANPAIIFFIKLFTAICVLTSFLGVSLCLADFLADGFQIEKQGWGNFFVHVITFLPPLLIAIFFPGAFIKALEYGGLYTIILLVLLPAFMAWRGRYNKHLSNGFKVPGGKPLLIVLILFSLVMIATTFIPALTS